MTPYTARAIATLAENGFIEASFYVPFSASDYPKREAKRWKFLQEKAKRHPKKTSRQNVKILQRAPHWSFASSRDEKELHDPGRGTASKACML